MRRREFLRLLALAAASGATLQRSDAQAADALYGTPRFGNVSVLHFTDSHAQLLPLHFREPSANLGAGEAAGRPPHLVGAALLEHFRIDPKSALAHAYAHLDFVEAARRYGKIYNAKAYNLCSQMPRMGHSGTLDEQQIKDLVAYLLDPGSPVNQ